MLPSLSLSVEFLGALLVLANCLWIALTIFNGIFAIKLYSGKEKYRIPMGILGGINFAFFIFVIIFSAIKKIGVSLIAINIISDSLQPLSSSASSSLSIIKRIRSKRFYK